MRWLAIAFGVLILALQYPMWLGKGGWLQVREYDRQLAAQREANARLKMRNDALDADVRDLKTGSEAIEERARAVTTADREPLARCCSRNGQTCCVGTSCRVFHRASDMAREDGSHLRGLSSPRDDRDRGKIRDLANAHARTRRRRAERAGCSEPR